MAFLIPLFAPTIIETTTNIALGISNSIQGDHSSISLQLGKKVGEANVIPLTLLSSDLVLPDCALTQVFSNHQGFPLTQLPYELREEIILMALEESRSFVVLSPSFALLHR
jgi:hypothetical protein